MSWTMSASWRRGQTAGQAGPRPQTGLEPAQDGFILKERSVRARLRSGRKEQEVAFQIAAAQGPQELVSVDEQGLGFLFPENVDERGIGRVRFDEIGEDADRRRDLGDGRRFAFLGFELAQGQEMMGRFVALVPEAGDARAQGLDGFDGPGQDAARFGQGVFPLDDPGRRGGLAAFEFGQVLGLGLELFVRFGLPGQELFLLAADELDFLFQLGLLVVGRGDFGQLLNSVGAARFDRFGPGGDAGLGLLVGSGQIVRFAFPAGQGFGLRRDLVPDLMEAVLQGQKFGQKLVRIGRRFAAPAGQIVGPADLPVALGLGPGDLRLERIQPFLSLLEGLFDFPGFLPFQIDRAFFLGQAGHGVALAGQAFVVLGLDFALAGLEKFAFVLEMEDGQLADALAELAVALGRAGLAGQRILGLGHFGDDVLEPGQVELGVLEFPLGLAPLVAVIGRPGGLLDQEPFLGGLGRNECADRALLDDIVLVFGDGLLPQLFLDILEPHGLAVQAVFTIARPEHPVVDLHLLFGVLQHQGDVGHAHGRALEGAGEDGVLGLLAADGPHALAAQHPLDGLDDVALAGAVGADDDGDSGIEENLRPFGERFESLKFEPFDIHGLSIGGYCIQNARR